MCNWEIWKETKAFCFLWGIHDNGNGKYYAKSSNSTGIYFHRFVCLRENFKEVNKVVDHKNGCSLDNRIENLRMATFQENLRNSIQRKNSTHKGVRERLNKSGAIYYAAFLIYNGKEKSLGNFQNLEDALEARKKAEYEFFWRVLTIFLYKRDRYRNTCSTNRKRRIHRYFLKKEIR